MGWRSFSMSSPPFLSRSCAIPRGNLLRSWHNDWLGLRFWPQRKLPLDRAVCDSVSLCAAGSSKLCLKPMQHKYRIPVSHSMTNDGHGDSRLTGVVREGLLLKMTKKIKAKSYED